MSGGRAQDFDEKLGQRCGAKKVSDCITIYDAPDVDIGAANGKFYIYIYSNMSSIRDLPANVIRTIAKTNASTTAALKTANRSLNRMIDHTDEGTYLFLLRHTTQLLSVSELIRELSHGKKSLDDPLTVDKQQVKMVPTPKQNVKDLLHGIMSKIANGSRVVKYELIENLTLETIRLLQVVGNKKLIKNARFRSGEQDLVVYEHNNIDANGPLIRIYGMPASVQSFPGLLGIAVALVDIVIGFVPGRWDIYVLNETFERYRPLIEYVAQKYGLGFEIRENTGYYVRCLLTK